MTCEITSEGVHINLFSKKSGWRVIDVWIGEWFELWSKNISKINFLLSLFQLYGCTVSEDLIY